MSGFPVASRLSLQCLITEAQVGEIAWLSDPHRLHSAGFLQIFIFMAAERAGDDWWLME